MQRSYDDTIPMQEVAKEAMHGLRSRFGGQLHTTSYRDLPALDPGNFGPWNHEGPSGTGNTGSSPTQPMPAPSTVSTTSSMTMIADMMLFHTMKEELIRNQEAIHFWFHNFQRSEYDRSLLHGALNMMVPGGPLNPIPIPDDIEEEQEEEDPEEVEEDPEELVPEEELEGVEEVDNPAEPPAPPPPIVPPAPPQLLPENGVAPAPLQHIQQQPPHPPIPEQHQPVHNQARMSVSLREYREALAYARELGVDPWSHISGGGTSGSNGNGGGGSSDTA